VTAQTLYELLLRDTIPRPVLTVQAARVEQAMDTFQQAITTCPVCQAIGAMDADRQRAIDGQFQELVGRVTFIVLHCSWRRMSHEQLATYVNGLFWDVDDLVELIDIAE
jgi:hypothetical protein